MVGEITRNYVGICTANPKGYGEIVLRYLQEALMISEQTFRGIDEWVNKPLEALMMDEQTFRGFDDM